LSLFAVFPTTKVADGGLGTCPGGDLSLWGFGSDSEQEMIKCCRPLKVEVFRLEDTGLLERSGWKPAPVAPYHGLHGMKVWEGEPQKNAAQGEGQG